MIDREYTYTRAPQFTGKVVWTPETGWTDDGPTIRRIGHSWYVISDGSSVGFADWQSAMQYIEQVQS
jgi:hypothetical protein